MLRLFKPTCSVGLTIRKNQTNIRNYHSLKMQHSTKISATPGAQLAVACSEAFCNPENIYALLESEDASDSSDHDALRQCGRPILCLLHTISSSIKNRYGDYTIVIQRLEDLTALATEKFYAFPFRDVPPCWRALFREAGLLKFTALTLKNAWGSEYGLENTSSPDEDTIDDMVKAIDMALIMAGPSSSPGIQEAIESMFGILQNITNMPRASQPEVETCTPASKRRRLDLNTASWQDRFPVRKTFIPSVSVSVPRIARPSFGDFEKSILQVRDPSLGPEPFIITDALDHWPARGERPWASPSYLLSRTIGGRRLVPIEFGRSYVDEGWGQKIITFKEFMEEYILLEQGQEKSTGYLAQHNLFAQVPSLREDIAVPDYCYTSPPPPHKSSPLAEKHSKLPPLDDPLLNAWFGPAGTISPLHTDPYHNILAQVVGRKYIRLYAPRESDKLYARGIEDGGIDMENTSAVDIGLLEGWDGSPEERNLAHEQFPLVREANYVDCILEEGECLYIPVGWWHYVRSLSISFSISFWFN
jgi:hypothetical protein